MSQILDKLFLGKKQDATTKIFLTKHGITHIFNCAWEAAYKVPKDIKYYEMKLKDQQDFPMMDYLDKAADHINKILTEENGTLFVHCMWGVSRSATLVIAYLIKYQNWSCCEAKEYVKQRRSEISPNRSFWRILQDYCGRLHPGFLNDEKHSHEKLEIEETVKKANPPTSFKVYKEDVMRNKYKGATAVKSKNSTLGIQIYEKEKKKPTEIAVEKIKIEDEEGLEVDFKNEALKENPSKE